MGGSFGLRVQGSGPYSVRDRAVLHDSGLECIEPSDGTAFAAKDSGDRAFMKTSVLLAGLILASLTVSASAEKHRQPKARPSYSDEKAKGSRPVKTATAPRSSSAQELHRIEQSGARASTARKAGEGKTRRPAGMKPLKQDGNPPIHFASSGSSGGKGSNGKAANNYKGRLRHKGSHR